MSHSCTQTQGWQLGKEKQLATQQNKIKQKIKEYEKNKSFCKECNAPLSYFDVKKKKTFCSRKCNTIFQNRIRSENGNTTTVCFCGKSFTRKSYKAAVFCSLKCQMAKRAFDASKSNIELLKEGKLALRSTIKKTLLAMGVEHKCQICGLTDWMGKPISMVLDHINGRADNNFPDNLRFICHNCDSQTDHYKGRNKGNGRKSLGLI